MINNPYTTGIQLYIFSWGSFLKQEENFRLVWPKACNDERVFESLKQLDKDYSYILTNDDKIEDLVKVIIPNIEYTKNALEKNFFLKQLCDMCLDNTKYKLFCIAYKQLLNI